MAYITCPSCNKRITDKLPFCRYCGKTGSEQEFKTTKTKWS